MLINEHTASATEMVAGFAVEHRLATLVGVRTAGQVLGGVNSPVGLTFTLRLPLLHGTRGKDGHWKAAAWRLRSGSLSTPTRSRVAQMFSCRPALTHSRLCEFQNSQTEPANSSRPLLLGQHRYSSQNDYTNNPRLRCRRLVGRANVARELDIDLHGAAEDVCSPE